MSAKGFLYLGSPLSFFLINNKRFKSKIANSEFSSMIVFTLLSLIVDDPFVHFITRTWGCHRLHPMAGWAPASFFVLVVFLGPPHWQACHICRPT